MMKTSDIPEGELTLRTLAMPGDANPAGDIFGGWVMAQMDLAAGIRAGERARCRVVTAAVKEMAFQRPVKIGDTLCIYTSLERIGRSSITLTIEAWAQRYLTPIMEKVTAATFVMVALDKERPAYGRCRPLVGVRSVRTTLDPANASYQVRPRQTMNGPNHQTDEPTQNA